MSTTDIGINAGSVVAKRYSLKKLDGTPKEAWPDVVKRVVEHVAQGEFTGNESATFEQKDYNYRSFVKYLTDMMLTRRFLPNTPCLVNAGKPNGQLAACFVLPVPDSIDGIMEHAKQCALIHQSGGGTGMTYERLRPYGSPVAGGRGIASGPVSFMQIVNTMTETVKQGGVRRGANMGILAVEHPDILRFIHAKNDQKSLTNFNISVTVSDKFLKAVENNEWFQTEFDGKPWDRPIFDPKANDGEGGDYSYNGEVRPGKVYAPDIWQRIIESTHRWAEPGIIFIDNVNKHNPLKASMGLKKASNPCAEQMLHDYNACNLGSLDVSKYHDGIGGFDWLSFKNDIHWAVRFLDNVIDVCAWPLPEIEDTVKRTRPIGLGIMGFADLLIKERIIYGSDQSVAYAHKLMDFFRKEAWLASNMLGKEKGVMPELEPNIEAYQNLYNDIGLGHKFVTPRNYEVTTVAPTGTISLVAETSSGCEPNFSYAYVRRDTIGTRTYAHPLAARALGIELDNSDPESIAKAADHIVANRDKLPEYFVDAMTLKPEAHLAILSAFQDHVDNSISKTVNAPADFTLEDTDRVHRMAWKMGVKAVSYYRDGSRDGQVLTAVTKDEKKPELQPETNPKPTASTSSTAPRPVELVGSTWRIKVNDSSLYATINHDGVSILEVFATGAGLSVSVGLLASKMLRGGFTSEEVASSLDKVIGGQSVWFNQKLCTSPEQILAECIRLTERRLAGKSDSSRNYSDQITSSPVTIDKSKTLIKCPECSGNQIEFNGSCYTCRDCGFSKCA